uniref:CHK kinase-like domain-containing protein n=1 Tax=Stomoxys calcitrans TaxID=35570 RepID=A0A1I8P7T0_STOCA
MTHLVNKLLIARVLANNHHTNIDNIEVQTSDVKLSSTNGENFCSDIYVAKVTYKLNGNDLQSSFIVKIMRPEIAEIGTNEEQMFTRVLPTMEGFFNRLRNAKIKLYPRCFLTEKVDGHEFYVLEDLNTMGYFCADRIRGLDEAHARLLMQKIGQFHAASLMYEKKFPEIVNSLGKSHFANGATDVVAEAIAFGGMEYVANMIETWAGYEQLSSKIRSLSARFNDKVKKVVDPQNSVVNVITHGDLWINNVLFRNEADTKHPIDVLFVDFQN